MKVDISPNFPPRSSCTAAAEFGEGLFGCGRSSASLSKRVIIVAPGRRERATFARMCPFRGSGDERHTTRRRCTVRYELLLGPGLVRRVLPEVPEGDRVAK